MSHNSNNSISYKIHNFRELYSYKDKDPQKLKDNQLNKLIKKEFIIIFFVIIAIICQICIFYYAAIYLILPNPILGDYIYSPSVREGLAYIAYYIAWIGILIILILIYLEIKFIVKYCNTFAERKGVLTIKKSRNAKKNGIEISKSKEDIEMKKAKNKKPEENSEEKGEFNKNNHKENTSSNMRIGSLTIEKLYFKIILLISIIIVNIVAMGYYLTRPGSLPSYIEISNDVASISSKDYFNFIIFMSIFLMIEVFLLISNIFGNYSRITMFKKIIYVRAQIEILTQIEDSNQNKVILNGSKKTKKVVGGTGSVNNEIDGNKKKIARQEIVLNKMNIYNTPIEKVREEKLKILNYRYKLAYLKEREKLLSMIEKDKLIAIYGKKGYKEHKKELAIRGYDDRNAEKKSIDKIQGYKIIKEKDKSEKVKEEVKKKIKENKKKDKTKKVPKKQFDFR